MVVIGIEKPSRAWCSTFLLMLLSFEGLHNYIMSLLFTLADMSVCSMFSMNLLVFYYSTFNFKDHVSLHECVGN